MRAFVYYTTLVPDEKEGGYVVTFPDLPEAITQGNDLEDALVNAADCLEEAIAYRIDEKLPIPSPSPAENGQHAILLSAQMAANAGLYIAIRESGMANVELAKRLGCNEKEVRRLLDPRHPSKLPRIESALSVLGKKLVVELQEAA